MTAWEVKDYLSHLTSWEENEEENILSLCKASLNEITSMLKADADRADARIASAAAANAYYKLSLKRSFSSSQEEFTSFKAGDISITQGNSQGHYLYIGPPDHDVSRLGSEQWIESNSQKFTVDRSEKVYFKNEVIYVWAIIREIVEVD